MVVRPTAVLRVVGSIPARDKYLYDLQIVVLDLAVCVCDFSVCTHDTGIIPSVAQFFLKKKKVVIWSFHYMYFL